jgi:hypothetical protein
MNNLFCTPEQGKKLKELAPNIESYFVYTFIPTEGYDEPRMVFVRGGGYRSYPEVDTYDYPALTLQELRDYACLYLGAERFNLEKHMELINFSDAQGYANWIIEALEATP